MTCNGTCQYCKAAQIPVASYYTNYRTQLLRIAHLFATYGSHTWLLFIDIYNLLRRIAPFISTICTTIHLTLITEHRREGVLAHHIVSNSDDLFPIVYDTHDYTILDLRIWALRIGCLYSLTILDQWIWITKNSCNITALRFLFARLWMDWVVSLIVGGSGLLVWRLVKGGVSQDACHIPISDFA